MDKTELARLLQMTLWYYETFRDPREKVGPTEQDDMDWVRRTLITARKQGLLPDDSLTTSLPAAEGKPCE